MKTCPFKQANASGKQPSCSSDCAIYANDGFCAIVHVATALQKQNSELTKINDRLMMNNMK